MYHRESNASDDSIHFIEVLESLKLGEEASRLSLQVVSILLKTGSWSCLNFKQNS